MTLNAVPAGTAVGADTLIVTAAPGATAMLPEVPVSPPDAVPVMVCVPAVSKTADEMLPAPLVIVTLPSALARGSVLVNVTMPE